MEDEEGWAAGIYGNRAVRRKPVGRDKGEAAYASNHPGTSIGRISSKAKEPSNSDQDC